jgi:ABC-type amino acid transport substrate-binding protein
MNARARGSWLFLVLALALQGWAAWAADETPPLRIGFYLPGIRDVNQADLKISLNQWTEEVARPFGIKIIPSTYDSMPAMRQALERGDLNFINAPGMELAELFSPQDIREGYARRIEGVDEGLALVVPRDSDAREFRDLKRRRLMRLGNDRLADYYLETQCMKAGRQACGDFLVLTDEKRDIQSVYAVFFGRVDAALVHLSTLRAAMELNPQIAHSLRVLQEWKAKGMYFGIMTRHTDPAYRSMIINSAREALKTVRGRQLLELFRTDYLEPVDAGALKPYWALLATYRDLRKTLGAGR